MRHGKVIWLALLMGMGGCVEKASFPMPSSPSLPSSNTSSIPSFPTPSPPPFASPPTLTHNSPHLVLGNPSNAGQSDPNNLLLNNPQYALSYNASTGTANWASWQLSQEWIGDVKRTDDFRPDEQLPLEMQISPRDYSRSGYDRGHLVPAADRDRSIEDVSSTFVMSNMVPQTPDLNRGAWADFEAYCRELANQGYTLYIVAGPVGNRGQLKGKVTVPSHTWKVVVVTDGKQIPPNTRTIAAIVPNQPNLGAWHQYRVSIDEIERVTDLDFLNALPTNLQAVLESGVDSAPIPMQRQRR